MKYLNYLMISANAHTHCVCASNQNLKDQAKLFCYGMFESFDNEKKLLTKIQNYEYIVL